MKKINVIIDGKTVLVPENFTVLQAAKEAGIAIPTLCFLKDINEIGACRICLVEVKGTKSLQAACVYPVSEGLEVCTYNAKIREARKTNLELILSNHKGDCLTCMRSSNCELRKLSEEFFMKEVRFLGKEKPERTDQKSASITRDLNKCVLCRRCVSVCNNVQTVCAINTMNRGFDTEVGTAFDMSIADVPCVNCGQCVNICPVGAINAKDDTERTWDAINDPDKYVIVQTAPAVRVAIGEEFGMPIGTRATANLAGALKRMGFDKVFDTNTAADLTIMEEGTELLERIKNGEKLPLITSCSPGWIKFAEHFYPEFLENLSTCKSPHQMFGAMLKTYFAEKEGIDPSKIFVVSVMPCTAKKFESSRPEMTVTGFPDVDAVVTTRGIAKMMKEQGIDLANIHDGQFDLPMGEATGAGAIFGATGGVMEAALRTVADILNEEDAKEIEYPAVRGTNGIKIAQVEAGGMIIKAAVAHGLGNARKLLDRVKAGEEFHFIEIMACPGGCVTGGGQPIVSSRIRSWIDLKGERAKAIYDEDRNLPIRKSHQNEVIQKMYDEFLGEPGSHKAHELLHTTYKQRENYPL